MVAVVSGVVGGVVGDSPEAHAYQGYQYNLLGWANGTKSTSWGNYGSLAPANDLINTMAAMANFGAPWPVSVTTEETCFTTYGQTSDSQFNRLYGFLALVTGGTYTWGFASEQAVDYNHFQCSIAGEGVIALANNVNAVWAVMDDPHLYRLNDTHDRRMVCVYPVIYVVNGAVCGAHLSNKLADADSELFGTSGNNTLQAHVYEWFNTAPKISQTTVRILGGDFNLNWQYVNPLGVLTYVGTPNFLTAEVDSGIPPIYTYPADTSATKKIDYVFGMYPYQPSAVGVFLPGTCSSVANASCTDLKDHRVSDHRIVTGHL
jgi:hypothetical protein